MNLVVVIGVALAAVAVCEGVVFTRCELVKQLRKQGFPEPKMRDWVCLVEHESGRDTKIVSKPNYDGSRDYGLFQINDRYWCSRSEAPGKDCNVSCSALVSNDITAASKCAKKVYQRHGFSAWNAWKTHCQGSLPDIKNC